jgi:cell division protein FtsB
MIEVIIAVVCFVFLGFACIYLGFGWLEADKRHKSENACLKQDNEALVREVKMLRAKNQFYKNELENKE